MFSAQVLEVLAQLKLRVTMVVVFCRVFVIGVHDITSLKLF